MTTLATNTPRAMVGGAVNEIPVIASDIIYEGAAVGVVTASGHARPLTAVDRFVGFAIEQANNAAGAAAAINCRVWRSGTAVLTVAGAVITDIGQPVYATDDNAFAMLPTGGVFIGFVRRFISSNLVEVGFDVDNYTDPYANKVKETLGAATHTLDAQDNAKYIFVTVDSTVTLPATATALRNCTLVMMAPFGTVQIVATPNGSDKIAGANIAPADGATVTNTKATAQRGDLITLDFGATDGPAITEIKGTWAAA
jgi:hypothetical protein